MSVVMFCCNGHHRVGAGRKLPFGLQSVAGHDISAMWPSGASYHAHSDIASVCRTGRFQV